MRTICFLIVLFLLSPIANADVKIKSCEDWDKDGRFGIVSHVLAPPPVKTKTIRANIGVYAACLSKSTRTPQCKGKSTLCTCEDHDKDGRFGIVKHPNKKYSTRVVKSNIGNYYQCVSQKSRYRNTSARYYSCEDWNKDGRFGIVQHNLKEKAPKPSILKSNHGNYYSCTAYKSSLSQCKGNSLCTCEDWNKDGRFGVVKYPGKKKGSKVLKSNIGTYAQCLSKM